MRGKYLTTLQRQAMEHMERARSQGLSLSDYAKVQGVSVRQIYDAASQLRRRGVLPSASCPTPSPFMAVKLLAPSSRCVCRIVNGSGVMIECLEWPPARWLATLASSACTCTGRQWTCASRSTGWRLWPKRSCGMIRCRAQAPCVSSMRRYRSPRLLMRPRSALWV